MRPASYDVVLVGLGMAGGMFLDTLLRVTPDLRVAVVERGRMWDPGRPEPIEGAPSLHATVADPEHEIVLTEGPGAGRPVQPWWMPRRAGGGSVLWYGQMHRFDDFDTSPSGLPGYPSVHDHEWCDWPVQASELAADYATVARALEPYTAGGSSAEVPGGRVRSVLSGLETVVCDALGGDPRAAPHLPATCLGGRSWDRRPFDPLTLTQVEDPPLSVRPNVYEQTQAALDGMTQVDVLDSRRLLRLHHEDGRVTGCAVVGPDGVESTLSAPIVVLACGTIESTRAVLVSDIAPASPVGSRLTFINELSRYVVTDIPRVGDARDDGLESFATVAVSEPGAPTHPFRGKLTVYNAVAFEAPEKAFASAAIDAEERAQLRVAGRSRYVLKVSFKGESIPWSGKRVGLGRSRATGRSDTVVHVHYERHPFDEEVRRRGLEAIDRVASATGGVVLPAVPAVDVTSAHVHGGLPFGRDPRRSVLSDVCEVHHCAGLFAVDGSFMPTSGHTNASWTIMANAVRIGRHVAARAGGS